jgi:hypothetical protein
MEYRAPLATAVRYLMDYMFTLCIAPAMEDFTDVPIKLWAKYMPDTLDRLLRDLFQVPSDASFGDVKDVLEESAGELPQAAAPTPAP